MRSLERRIHRLVLCALAIGLSLLAGCGNDSAPTLRLGTNVWPGYEPLYLARDLGYLDDRKVRLVEHSSASQVIRDFLNGTIDAAALTLDEALLLVQGGHEPRIVLVTDISAGGDVILGRPELQTLRDIKGRRVAVESTALGAYVLARALEFAELSANEISVVREPVNRHAVVYEEGLADAVVTFEPVRS